MVGTGRFELPTPRTPSECSTRLSHVPTKEGTHCAPYPGARAGVDVQILQHPAQFRPLLYRTRGQSSILGVFLCLLERILSNRRIFAEAPLPVSLPRNPKAKQFESEALTRGPLGGTKSRQPDPVGFEGQAVGSGFSPGANTKSRGTLIWTPNFISVNSPVAESGL